jgi:hypothetical protein
LISTPALIIECDGLDVVPGKFAIANLVGVTTSGPAITAGVLYNIIGSLQIGNVTATACIWLPGYLPDPTHPTSPVFFESAEDYFKGGTMNDTTGDVTGWSTALNLAALKAAFPNLLTTNFNFSISPFY